MRTKETTYEEARRLAERFRAIQNRAQFGRDIGLSQAMIYQHINGVRPISIDAARKYANGFGCAIEDISPSAVEEARKALDLLPSSNSTGEPPPAYLLHNPGGAMNSNVVKIRERQESLDTAESGYVRLEHLSVQPRMGMGATITEPVHLVRHLDVLEGWLRDEVGSIDPRRVKVLTAVGRSMLPTIKDRDLVFVDVAHRHFDAPGIYVIDVAGRLLLKKVMIKADGTLVIRSDNTAEFPDEETYRIDEAANDVTLCGKVLAWWTLRKG